MADKAAVIAEVCHSVSSGAVLDAANLLRREYPFTPEPAIKRTYGPVESMRIFVRDGFRDRYTGECLVLPAVLRALSQVLPNEFPFHPNWKSDVTHPAYWEIGATIDHVIPVTRGGVDDETNWVTTSMVRNSAKSNWTIEELGWSLYPPGNFQEWDGLTRWFVDFCASHPELLENPSIRQWHRAVAVFVVADRTAGRVSERI